MRPIPSRLGLVAAFCVGATCYGNTLYNVNLTVGLGSATGDILTDGATGPISSSDVVDWSLTGNNGTSSFTLLGPLSGNNSILAMTAGAASATPTQILFDFSATNNYMFFLGFTGPVSGSVVCFVAAPNSGICPPVNGVGQETVTYHSVTQAQAEAGTVVIAGDAASVPEPSTLALLFAGALLLGLGIARRRLLPSPR